MGGVGAEFPSVHFFDSLLCAKMTFFQFAVPAFALLALLGLIPAQTNAFKLKTHIQTANLALAGTRAPRTNHHAAVYVSNLRQWLLADSTIVRAVLNHPTYFRAGVLGPDCFPDLVMGQFNVHVNRGSPKPSGHTFESRKINQWRSIDYGMYQLDQAFTFAGRHTNERQQAIAFSVGYLSHMIGDGFMHSYVNEWTLRPFSLWQGRGIYGSATEELKHMAVEAYIDKHMPPVHGADLKIDAPIPFLQAMYQRRRRGKFAGELYEVLLEVQTVFNHMRSHRRWHRLARVPSLSIFRWARHAIQLHEMALDIVSLGGRLDVFVQSPVKDVEHFFQRRYRAITALLDGWVHLSTCIAQNLVYGSNTPRQRFACRGVYKWLGSATTGKCVVRKNACASLNLEKGRGAASVFRGELNKVVRHVDADDFGSLPTNLAMLVNTVKTVASKILSFSIVHDIWSVSKVLNFIDRTCKPVVRWRSCRNACKKAGKKCTRVVSKTVWRAVCLLCPRRRGKPSCRGWKRKLMCIANPVCFACRKKWTKKVLKRIVNSACAHTVAAAAPVCYLCNTHPLCHDFRTGKDLLVKFDRKIRRFVKRLTDALIDRLLNHLVKRYTGTSLDSFKRLYGILRDAFHDATTNWFVNMAFIEEDLRADNGTYFNQVVSRSLGLTGNVVGNALLVGEFSAQMVASIASQTYHTAVKALKLYLFVSSDAIYEKIWNGLLEVLLRLARDRNFNFVRHITSGAMRWLDGWKFKDRTAQKAYTTRRQRFLGLVIAMRLFAGVKGPALTQLKRELGLTSSSSRIDMNRVHFIFNTVELTKLSFLHKSALERLAKVRLQEASFLSRRGLSRICKRRPHIVCDVIQSLDEPTPTTRSLAMIPAERSVVPWIHRPRRVRRASGRYHQASCRIRPTNFILARDKEHIVSIWKRLFKSPRDCTCRSQRNFRSCRWLGICRWSRRRRQCLLNPSLKLPNVPQIA